MLNTECANKKPVFKPYYQHQLMAFPPSLDELIPADHTVRLVDKIINVINVESLLSAYHIRAFAPPRAFKRTGFYDDNRGFSKSINVTSRIKQNFTVDPTARTFTGGQPTSDPTIWNGFSRTATDEGGAF